ncbi:MAG: hypothetical protein ACRYFZ_15965 [Janthinobacterium lividum]
MHLNTAPCTPARLPNMVELDQLISPHGLLPKHIVPLLPLKQLKRRIREINATHPQYQEETPLVLAYETQRRRQLSGALQVTVVNHSQVA